MTSLRIIVPFLLALISVYNSFAADQKTHKVQAVEIFGVGEDINRKILSDFPIKVFSQYPYRTIQDEAEKYKSLLKKREGFADVNASVIYLQGYGKQLKTGVYISFDIVKAEDPMINNLRPHPDKEIVLTNEMKVLYDAYTRLSDELESKEIFEQDKYGYYYYDDPAMIALIKKIKEKANSEFVSMRELALYAKDPSQRSMAVQMIAAASNKKRLVPVLLEAVRDPNFGVRNDAARVMIPVAAFGVLSKRYSVPIEPFIKMIQLPRVTDRNKAAAVISRIIASDPDRYKQTILSEIKGLLIRMAKSKQPNNYMYARGILKKLNIRY